MIAERETGRARGDQGAENYRRTKVLSIINFRVFNFRPWVDRGEYFATQIFQNYGNSASVAAILLHVVFFIESYSTT